MDITRRRFLELSGVALCGAILFLSGCGGSVTELVQKDSNADVNITSEEINRLPVTEFEQDAIAPMATAITVGVAMGNNTPKKVQIYAGQTVIDSIKKAYSYSKGTSSTTINGIKGNWIYTINGSLPSTYAGSLKLTNACTIRLYKMT